MYSIRVTEGLKRYHETGSTHFLTFSCYHREPLLKQRDLYGVFLKSLEWVRRKYGLRVYGYVLMPEHVHLLVSEPAKSTLARVIQALKVSVVRNAPRLPAAEDSTIWQARYYDRNVRDHEEFLEKLRTYIEIQ